VRVLIIEDDINVIKILERIINDRALGQVIGYALDGVEGKNKIDILNPDIVLVDLLMPGKDGISLVSEVKSNYPEIQFVMISQVSSKDMIGKAYQSGVEYFVNKPVNAIEVENVIHKVIEKAEMNRKINQIQELFVKPISFENKKEDYSSKIKRVMQKVGIMGEIGSKDIIKIVEYLIKSKKNMTYYTIKELCGIFTDNPKSMEQRIRRTAVTGMVNMANIGIEDYMNEVFVEYSTGLYNFEQIKKEMDYIRGKSKIRGKINLKKFIDGMVFYCEK
jgi:two-component system response regulator YcbB